MNLENKKYKREPNVQKNCGPFANLFVFIEKFLMRKN